MSKYLSKILAPVVGCILVAGSAGEVSAQLDHLPYQLKYDRGQTVQPVYEGWSLNPDGTYDLHFGYLNRNYQEELVIPVGADNRFEPGNPDQGQPTYFHVRSNRNIFTITVPADFGDQKLTWSLTAHGETLSAIGWLDPRWEILENDVGADGDPLPLDEEPNEAPALTLDGSSFTVTLPTQLTMTARVSDDGYPKPRPEQQRGPAAGTQAQPPLLTPPENALPIPTNIRQHEDLEPPSPPRGRATVTYTVWRGPADITVEPYLAEPVDGSATTAITFSEPGEYQLKVSAHDGDLSTDEFVTVSVR